MIFATRSGPTSLGGTASAAAGATNGNTDAWTFRTGSTLKLQSERMAGFQVGAMAVLNDANRTQTAATGGQNNQQGWGLGANYQWKKLVVTAAYQSLQAVQTNNAAVLPFNVAGQSGTAAAVGGITAQGLAVGGISGGANVQDNQMYAGAMYDFGILKAYASYINRKVTSQIDSNQYAKRSAQEIGVRGNWTPKIESFASVGNGSFQTFGQGEPTANLVGYQLGTNYIMSKRTNLYAIYGYSGTSNASRIAGGYPTSFNTSNYAVGMRHTF
jgi:predicted porin